MERNYVIVTLYWHGLRVADVPFGHCTNLLTHCNCFHCRLCIAHDNSVLSVTECIAIKLSVDSGLTEFRDGIGEPRIKRDQLTSQNCSRVMLIGLFSSYK